MSVRKEISEHNGIYFITITCARWLKLFELANGYDAVYKWFDYLKSKGHIITGYVIMPNHMHALIAFRHTQGKSINAIIGNGKRFMAYELIKKLKERNATEMLHQLSSFVNETEKLKGKLHEVFEPSFDWKECTTEKFLFQKLDYIHDNPCRGSWELVKGRAEYLHSSARYYDLGEASYYEVTNVMVLEDIDLTTPLLGE